MTASMLALLKATIVMALAAATTAAPPALLGHTLDLAPCNVSSANQRWTLVSTSTVNNRSVAPPVTVVASVPHPTTCLSCPGSSGGTTCHSWACSAADRNGGFYINRSAGVGRFTIHGSPLSAAVPAPAGANPPNSCVTVQGAEGIGNLAPCATGPKSLFRYHASNRTLVPDAQRGLCLTLGGPQAKPGICPDGTDCSSSGGTCCKLKEPFGYGCALGGSSVCCDDQVHYCPAGHTCSFADAPPVAGHVGPSRSWGIIGGWHCAKVKGEAAVRERARAILLDAQLKAAPPSPPSPAAAKGGGDDCFWKQGAPWATWPSSHPPARCAPGAPGDQRCTPYERSTDIQGVQFNGCDEHDGKVGYPTYGQSNWDASFPKLDLSNGQGGADTWYPWWAADGRWYSSYTDGTVGGVHSQSGGSAPSMHGQVVMEPAGGQGKGKAGDPGDMRMVQAASFAVNATPFEGNYPTGVWVSSATGKQILYYGTYPVMDGSWQRWNEDCTNWCTLGPFPGWVWSDDDGASWHNSGHYPQGATVYNLSSADGGTRDDFHAIGGRTRGGLFGECRGALVGTGNASCARGAPCDTGARFVEPCAVKLTYLRPVDYGQDNARSPDGKMYFTGYGSSRADGPVSWMSGDEAHLVRADPKGGPAAMNDAGAYEFYAGETGQGDAAVAKWSSSMADAVPLFQWWNQTGITACTYMPYLKKMICVVETTCLHCGVFTQFDFDTYLLEADSADAEFPAASKFKLISYMESFGPEAYFVHIPSRFSPDNALGVGYMAFAANFAEGVVLQGGNAQCGCSHCSVDGKCAMGGLLHPTGGVYGMNLQKIRLCGPALNISCDSRPRPTQLSGAEAVWVPPTLEDFERQAERNRLLRALDDSGADADAEAIVAPPPPPPPPALPIVALGIDVDANTPRAGPPAGFAKCAAAAAESGGGGGCATSLLGEWVKLAAGATLPAVPDVWTARLWTQLVGNATFDTVSTILPNSSVPLPDANSTCAANAKCARVLGFRGANAASTVLLLVNLDEKRSYVDDGSSGRALHYLHRLEWRLTVPSLLSDAVSLNGKQLAPGQRTLPPIAPLSLAQNANKAALTLPPLSLTFMQLGYIPGDGLTGGGGYAVLKSDDDERVARPRSFCDVTGAPFGAAGDGMKDDTLAIRSALSQCDEVLLPEDKSFLTGPLNLTSNQRFVVDGTLLASTNISDYPMVAPVIGYGWSIDSNCFSVQVPEIVPGSLNYQAIINSWRATNVTITGSGVIDGQGQPWYERCMTCHYPPPVGQWPNSNASCLQAGRPMLLQFNFVDGLNVHGAAVDKPLTLQNSPFWTFTPAYSQRIRIKDLRILAPMNVIGNTDGIDICSSRDAIVENIYINNSDDGVCMNGGAQEFAMNLAIPTEDVLVRNITCPRGGRGGFRVGIAPGGVRNVTFRDCLLDGQRGLQHTGVVGGGGYMHDILYENIHGSGAHISFDHYPAHTCPGATPPREQHTMDNFDDCPKFLPKIYNIEFRDVASNGRCGNCAPTANGSVCPNITYTGSTKCGAPPPPPAPLVKCPSKKYAGGFIHWVTVTHKSNVYGEILRPFNRSSPGLPFLGLFDTAQECQAACEARSNCTQISWALNVPEFEKHCFGRCDNVWQLHAVPSQYTVVAARRVAAADQSTQSTQSNRNDVPDMRYGCKRNATDQYGAVLQFPWPVCIPLPEFAPVNLNRSWPNWGPVEGDFPTLAACKASGCKTDDEQTGSGSGDCVSISQPAGIDSNTKRIQAALDAASKVSGGGCVAVSGGDYYVRSLSVRSNTTFRVESGTRLMAKVNQTLTAVVHVKGASHVTLEGGGTIYGSAEDYWVGFSMRDDRMQPISKDGSMLRGHCLLVEDSQYVELRGLRFHNSSDWTVRLDGSDHIHADGIDIYGDWRFPNNDGFDPESCTNVTLINSHINVADDAICPKAGARPLKGLTVRNCTIRSHSGAIKFGSNTDSDMSDIMFDNISIWDSNGGLKIQQRSQGNIHNVTYSNIVLETRYCAPRWWGNGEWLGLSNSPRDDGHAVGTMSMLRFVNISGRSENGGLISGLSGGSRGATDISFENVHIKIDSWSNYSSGAGPPCAADGQICSNESHPLCVKPGVSGVAPGANLTCMGTRDYRPHNGGNCSYYCRTPAKANGIHVENVHGLRFKNVTFEYALPRKAWMGECFSADKHSTGIVGADSIRCINGPSAESEGRPLLKADDDFAVVAYLPEWRYEGANWDIVAQHVSHLILFSIEVRGSGELGALDRIPRPALMAEAQEAATKHGTALLICFGGNGRSAGFSQMVRSDRSRAVFLKNLVALMSLHRLDGVDYNWEYPGYEMGRGYLSDAEVTADYAGLMKLFVETRTILGASAPITMSYYPDGRQEELLLRGGAADSVDYLMMMSYDQTGGDGHHSERGWGNRMVMQGKDILPAQQLCAGLPFYGRHSTDGNWVTYEDIVQQHAPLPPDADVVASKDDGGKPSKLGFNGVATIEHRTAHSAKFVGGVMIWEVGQDCRLAPTVHTDGSSHVRTCPGEGDKNSLLTAITRARAAAGRGLVRFSRGKGGKTFEREL